MIIYCNVQEMIWEKQSGSCKTDWNKTKNHAQTVLPCSTVSATTLMGVLVFIFMAHGTLCVHLYETGNAPLSWNRCQDNCNLSAEGLVY